MFSDRAMIAFWLLIWTATAVLSQVDPPPPRNKKAKINLVVVLDATSKPEEFKNNVAALQQLPELLVIDEQWTQLSLITYYNRAQRQIGLTDRPQLFLDNIRKLRPVQNISVMAEGLREAQSVLTNRKQDPERVNIVVVVTNRYPVGKDGMFNPSMANETELLKEAHEIGSQGYLYIIHHHTYDTPSSGQHSVSPHDLRQLLTDKGEAFLLDKLGSINLTIVRLVRKIEYDLCSETDQQACRYSDDSRDLCQREWMYKSRYWKKCDIIKVVAHIDRCDLKDCVVFCDDQWAWKRNCDCDDGRLREGENPLPIFLEFCPAWIDCSDQCPPRTTTTTIPSTAPVRKTSPAPVPSTTTLSDDILSTILRLPRWQLMAVGIGVLVLFGLCIVISCFSYYKRRRRQKLQKMAQLEAMYQRQQRSYSDRNSVSYRSGGSARDNQRRGRVGSPKRLFHADDDDSKRRRNAGQMQTGSVLSQGYSKTSPKMGRKPKKSPKPDENPDEKQDQKPDGKPEGKADAQCPIRKSSAKNRSPSPQRRLSPNEIQPGSIKKKSPDAAVGGDGGVGGGAAGGGAGGGGGAAGSGAYQSMGISNAEPGQEPDQGKPIDQAKTAGKAPPPPPPPELDHPIDPKQQHDLGQNRPSVDKNVSASAATGATGATGVIHDQKIGRKTSGGAKKRMSNEPKAPVTATQAAKNMPASAATAPTFKTRNQEQLQLQTVKGNTKHVHVPTVLPKKKSRWFAKS